MYSMILLEMMMIDRQFLIDVFKDIFQSDEHRERIVQPSSKGCKKLEFTVIERWPKFAESNNKSFYQNTTMYTIVTTKSGDVLGFYISYFASSWMYQGDETLLW